MIKKLTSYWADHGPRAHLHHFVRPDVLGVAHRFRDRRRARAHSRRLRLCAQPRAIDLNPEHPPLIKALAMLPVLFSSTQLIPTNIPAWTTEVNGEWDMGTAFLYKSGNNANEIIQTARVMPILITILTITPHLFPRAATDGKTVGAPAGIPLCARPDGARARPLCDDRRRRGIRRHLRHCFSF